MYGPSACLYHLIGVSKMQNLRRVMELTFSDLLVPHHHQGPPLGHLPVVATERDELCGSIRDIRSFVPYHRFQSTA